MCLWHVRLEIVGFHLENIEMALVFDVYCDFVTFPFGILGQVWYLIVSIPDPCCLSYFHTCVHVVSLYNMLECYI